MHYIEYFIIKMNKISVITVIAAIFIVFIIFIYMFLFYSPTDTFGVWDNPFTSKCIDGEQYTITKCNPNIITQRGCLNNNVQMYGNIIEIKHCGQSNIQFDWVETNTSDCINGIMDVEYLCTQIATNGGTNNCISTVDFSLIRQHNEFDSITLSTVC